MLDAIFGAFLEQLARVHEVASGGDLLIHPDLFAQTDFHLFC
jgi:hypothetical protein